MLCATARRARIVRILRWRFFSLLFFRESSDRDSRIFDAQPGHVIFQSAEAFLDLVHSLATLIQTKRAGVDHRLLICRHEIGFFVHGRGSIFCAMEPNPLCSICQRPPIL